MRSWTEIIAKRDEFRRRRESLAGDLGADVAEHLPAYREVQAAEAALTWVLSANREQSCAESEQSEATDYREVSRRFADIAEHHVRQHKER